MHGLPHILPICIPEGEQDGRGEDGWDEIEHGCVLYLERGEGGVAFAPHRLALGRGLNLSLATLGGDRRCGALGVPPLAIDFDEPAVPSKEPAEMRLDAGGGKTHEGLAEVDGLLYGLCLGKDLGIELVSLDRPPRIRGAFDELELGSDRERRLSAPCIDVTALTPDVSGGVLYASRNSSVRHVSKLQGRYAPMLTRRYALPT
jgi:hypothetical protein